jgi:hypothetical protein
MKLKLNYLFIIFLFLSCRGQENNKSKAIDVSKVSEITITNKMYCSLEKLKQGSIVIKDLNQIEKILDAFKSSTKINRAVNMSMHYGFFEINFKEGEIEHYYSLVYTMYEGVILSNNNNEDRFKNDRLEGVVNPLFVLE